MRPIKKVNGATAICLAVTGIMVMILFFMCGISIFVLCKIGTTANESKVIDWSREYPFEDSLDVIRPSGDEGIMGRIEKLIGMVEDAVGESMIWNDEFAYAGNWLESKIGWDVDCVTSYNPTYRLERNYIVNMKDDSDEVVIEKNVKSLVELSQFCEQRDIDFAYICLPNKLSEEADKGFDGIYQRGNKDADKLLKGLKEHNINYFDVRKELECGKYTDYHELFFNTDHHWKPQTGLRAAGALAEYLNHEFDYSLSLSVLDISNYREKIYRDYFLGSYGKKLTTAKVKLDDISLLYPNFKTDLTLKVPSLNIEKTGDFSIIYDYSQISEKFYEVNPYGAYLYSGPAAIRLYNHAVKDAPKVLVLKDSYSLVMMPFLALTVSRVDMLDLRGNDGFNGSVKSYIKKENPDIVLVSYYVDNVGWDRVFDFR